MTLMQPPLGPAPSAEASPRPGHFSISWRHAWLGSRHAQATVEALQRVRFSCDDPAPSGISIAASVIACAATSLGEELAQPGGTRGRRARQAEALVEGPLSLVGEAPFRAQTGIAVGLAHFPAKSIAKHKSAGIRPVFCQPLHALVTCATCTSRAYGSNCSWLVRRNMFPQRHCRHCDVTGTAVTLAATVGQWLQKIEALKRFARQPHA
ncbi:hypothetical protein GGD64_007714 [Bradyrhizobium sp. CIR3A]|nr:hypothetical protein [Bradyrhizobium sp. CIR3A]